MRDYSKLSIEERKAMNASARKKLAEGAISGAKSFGKSILKGAATPIMVGMRIGDALKNRFGKPVLKQKLEAVRGRKYLIKLFYHNDL